MSPIDLYSNLLRLIYETKNALNLILQIRDIETTLSNIESGLL